MNCFRFGFAAGFLVAALSKWVGTEPQTNVSQVAHLSLRLNKHPQIVASFSSTQTVTDKQALSQQELSPMYFKTVVQFKK